MIQKLFSFSIVVALFFSSCSKTDTIEDAEIYFLSSTNKVKQCYPVEFIAYNCKIDHRYEIYDYSWTFQGGNPIVMDNDTVVTTFNRPGKYTVTFTVGGKLKPKYKGRDLPAHIYYTKKEEDFITVTENCAYTFYGELVNEGPINIYVSEIDSLINDIETPENLKGQITYSTTVYDDVDIYCYTEGVVTVNYPAATDVWYYASDGKDTYGPYKIVNYFEGGGFSKFRIHLGAYN